MGQPGATGKSLKSIVPKRRRPMGFNHDEIL
jgi:hypothetical protein